MSISFNADNYADFVSVVTDLLTFVPGRVYWRNPGSAFQVVFVADDASRMVTFIAGASTPASFSTDFPSAIHLSSTYAWSLAQQYSWSLG